MSSPNKHALLAFVLGSVSVPIAGGLTFVARSAGLGASLWPWDLGLLLGLASLATSLRIPDAPLAFMVGACSFLLIGGIFGGSAAGFATMLIMAAAAAVFALAGELLAFVIRVVAHRRPTRP